MLIYFSQVKLALKSSLNLLDSLIFSSLHYHLVETSTTRKGTSEERPQGVRTPEIEKAMLPEIKEHPSRIQILGKGCERGQKQ